jgi:hypothetical protein
VVGTEPAIKYVRTTYLNSFWFFCYSLRPLISVFNMMYQDTKICLDTSCQR